MPSLITFSKLSEGNKVGAVDIYGWSLPFPRNMEIETEYLWEAEELGMIGSAIKNGQFDASTIAGATQALKGAGMGVIASAASAASGSGAVGGFGAANKIAVNPKEEVLFKGVKHRRFNMVFDLAPLSYTDSALTMAFLKILHVFAAPELIGGGAFYKYPDTVSVVVRGTEGVVVNRGNCAITSINCNMSPDSIWAVFKTGKPVHIVITISFMELDLPTQEKEKTLFG